MLFDRDNWQEIIHTLKKNRLRSALTAFGVFWGIFILMIMLGTGQGLYNGAMRDFGDLATNSVFVWARQTTKPYKGLPRGRRFVFTNEDIASLLRHIPEIEHLAPRSQLGGFRKAVLAVRGDKEGAFNIFGDYPEIIHINMLEIAEGRFINRIDLRERRKIAVIGERVRNILFDSAENPVGEFVEIQGVRFMVAGVFRPRHKASDDETESIFIPLGTFQQVFNYGNKVQWFSMTAKPNVSGAELEEKVVAFLAKRHLVAPDDTYAIGRWNQEKKFKKVANLFIAVDSLFWFVGIFTLLAGVIGVSNIMLVIIRERTPEIGIRRAIGATPLSIVGQIVMESVLLTTISGYLGLVCGIGVIEAVRTMTGKTGNSPGLFQNPEVELPAAGIALAILIVSGALAGLVPGLRAIRVKPVDAIRNQ